MISEAKAKLILRINALAREFEKVYGVKPKQFSMGFCHNYGGYGCGVLFEDGEDVSGMIFDSNSHDYATIEVGIWIDEHEYLPEFKAYE